MPPDRHGGGGHLRQAYLLLALTGRARVHLVSSQPVRDPLVRESVATLTELDVGEPPELMRPFRRARDVWLATFAHQPREVADAAAIRRALAPTVAAARADVYIVEYAGLAPLPLPRRNPGSKRVLTLHNIGSVMADHEAAVGVLARHRWLARRQAAKWRRWAGRELGGFDQVITVSEEDARSLGPHHRAAVVPNGVDIEWFTPTQLPGGPRLVFTGALYTGPNKDGLRWFCSEVLELIRQRHPDVSMSIVGMSPTADVAGLAQIEGVEIRPDVADVRPFLASARVAVVPLRIGSGTRLKVIEAMAAGRPVVSTSIGADGLGLEDGRHLLIADGPRDFASAVCRLIEDDGLAHSLTRAAHQRVETHFSWPIIQSRFAAIVLGGGEEKVS